MDISELTEDEKNVDKDTSCRGRDRGQGRTDYTRACGFGMNFRNPDWHLGAVETQEQWDELQDFYGF